MLSSTETHGLEHGPRAAGALFLLAMGVALAWRLASGWGEGPLPLRVDDVAGVLDERTERDVEEQLARFEERSGIRVLVLVGPRGVLDPDTYLAQRRRERPGDHALLHVVTGEAEPQVSFRVDPPLREALDPGAARRLAGQTMAREFRRGRLGSGVARGASALRNRLRTLVQDAGGYREWRRRRAGPRWPWALVPVAWLVALGLRRRAAPAGRARVADFAAGPFAGGGGEGPFGAQASQRGPLDGGWVG